MLNSLDSITHRKYQSVLLLLVLTCWWQFTGAYKLPNAIHVNPNIRCPGRNEINIWHPCRHGGYIENPDPKNCDDRYVCYVGLNEPCRRNDKCADNAICTVCGVCQKCDSPENCSDFNLCPMFSGYSAMNMIKRLMQKRLNNFNYDELA